jgi:hypothetical protein
MVVRGREVQRTVGLTREDRVVCPHERPAEGSHLQVNVVHHEAPLLYTMYVEPIRKHGLMRAIARVNRADEKAGIGLCQCCAQTIGCIRGLWGPTAIR